MNNKYSYLGYTNDKCRILFINHIDVRWKTLISINNLFTLFEIQFRNDPCISLFFNEIL